MESNILEQLNDLDLDSATKKIVQDQEKEKAGKYKHIKKTKDNNDVDYSVTEYVCPNGKVGFDIIFFKIMDKKEYIKKICYGEELTDRQHDWIEITNE